MLLRCAPPASSPSSLCHRRPLSFTGCVACTLQARLRQFRPGRASGISTTATPVHSQRCSSSGVSSMPLRPCHRRPCNPALAASTTVGRLQGGCHGVSCITQSSTTLSELASSRLRPTRSPLTSFFVVTAAACAAVPAHKCRSTLLSRRCITPMELTAN